MLFALVEFLLINAAEAFRASQLGNELQTAFDDVSLHENGDNFSTSPLLARDDQYTPQCNETACSVQCYELACLHRELPVPCPGKVTGRGFNVTIYEYPEGADIDPSQDFYDIHYDDYGIIGTNTGIEDLTLPFTEVADNSVKETIYGVENVSVAHFVADFRGFVQVNLTGVYTFQVFPLDYMYYGLGTNATTCCDPFGTYTKYIASVGGGRQPDSLEPDYDPNLFVSHYLYADIFYPARVLFVSNKRAPEFEFKVKGPNSDSYSQDLSGLVVQMENFENCNKLNPPTIDSSSIDTDSTTISSSSSTSNLPSITDSSVSASQTETGSYATSSSSSSASNVEVPTSTSTSESDSYTISDPSSSANTTETSSHTIESSSSSDSHVEAPTSTRSSGKSDSYTISDPSFSANTTETSSHTMESSRRSDSSVEISTSYSKSGLPSITNPSASGTCTKTGPYTIGSITCSGPYVEVGHIPCKSDLHTLTDTTASGTVTKTGPFNIGTSSCSGPYVEVGPNSSSSSTSDLSITKTGSYRNGTSTGSGPGPFSSASVFTNIGNSNIVNLDLILSSLFALVMLY